MYVIYTRNDNVNVPVLVSLKRELELECHPTEMTVRG